MNGTGQDKEAFRQALADAAWWLARLAADDRSTADERGLRQWLAESEDHRRAFMEITAHYEAVGGIPDVQALLPPPVSRRTRRAVLAGAAAMMVAGAAGGWRLWRGAAESYATDVGELRRIALRDGSALTLDTDSLVEVRLTASWRAIDLVRGRAHFDVAGDPGRPFVVRAQGRTVTALGTAFDVAQEEDGVTVVLVEGRVVVQPRAGVDAAPATFMAPGQRLVLRQGRAASLDRPDLTGASAWQQGQLVLEDRPLGEAVAEMNRYSRYRRLTVDDALAGRRISGRFGTQDAESFARSVSLLIGCAVEIRGDAILLHAAPVPAGEPGAPSDPPSV